jgi:hypothetical protein
MPDDDVFAQALADGRIQRTPSGGLRMLRAPTIAQLEAILNSEDDSLVYVKRDGSVTTWECKARPWIKSDPPQDCDWPTCGCDPAASKVIAALQEQGLLKTDAESS